MWIELIFGSIVTLTIWFLYCNNVTAKERLVIVEQCGDKAREMIRNGDYSSSLKAYDQFENVSYDKHLWYRFTFRDPHTLYLANDHESMLSVTYD